MSKTSGRKRPTLRIALAGVALLGIGAAITTAAWTDDVFFGATATASSFDLQGRAVLTPDADVWQDLGIPGETSATTFIDLDSTALAALSPGVTAAVPFELCNTGTAAGKVTAVSTPVLTGTLLEAAGTTISMMVTAPAVGTALPSDPACENPVPGTLTVSTSTTFPPEAQGTTGTIVFSVTGGTD